MPDVLDTALKRVRRRLWKRVGAGLAVYACLVGFIAIFAAPLATTLACLLIPSAIIALMTAFVHWTYHKGDPVVLREASRLAGGLLCERCAYDLRAIPARGGAVRCPECGHEQPA